MSEENKVVLEGGAVYITNEPHLLLKVTKGTVFIHILPMYDGGKTGRKLFIYEAGPGTHIPSLSYTDFEGKRWSFGISALKCAEIELSGYPSGDIEAVEKRKFCNLIALKNYEQEGFEEGLVEWYRINSVKEEAFIHKTAREQRQVYESGLNLIYRLFNKTAVHDAVATKDMIYEAVRHLCVKRSIPVADYEKVKISSGNRITVENIARVSHFICREITLEERWYKTDVGAVLVASRDRALFYACTPKKSGGYVAYDPQTGKNYNVNSAFAEKNFGHSGYMCYRPFENKKLSLRDMIIFASRSIQPRDFMGLLLTTLACALIGLFIPTLNQMLYDTFIPIGASNALIQVCYVILAFMMGNLLFSIVKNLANFRITSRITYDIQSAAYDRLFNLPESFFRQYDSGDLAQRVIGMGNFVNSLIGLIMSGIMTLIFSVVYLIRMLSYSKSLTGAAAAMVLIYAAVMAVLSLKNFKYEQKSMELNGKVSAVILQLLSGIAKIRVAGVEDRALYEYLKPYTKLKENEIRSDRIELLASTVSIAVNTIFSVVLYTLMLKAGGGISVGVFIAFSSAFGSFSSSVLSLIQNLISANYIKPYYERIKPIIETLPETNDSKELPGEISGDIELSNVSFAYGDSEPVLKGISLHIRRGEYIGIVGPSGCGKSTLLKLLLGFEKPSAGKIYYDGRDIERIDKRELRKKLGVVLQNGKLMSGSIYENITITAPNATYTDVTDVVEKVGLKEDIDNMPMGLHTVLSEDCSAISGGQQQRILIARAIVGRPQILYFDEATSALDNVTQSMVCESLDKLNVTRVVIAHRLSTIINCDRIIVINNGCIVEQGSYQELMENRGLFYELASRQIA